MARGLTTTSLARLAGWPLKMLNSIERDGVGTPEQIVRLGHALEVDPSWLLYGDKRPPGEL